VATTAVAVARFEVSMAMKIQVVVFCVTMPCGDVVGYLMILTFWRTMLPPYSE
jgi:hypothetical protein